jgi:hypothetical protein
MMVRPDVDLALKRVIVGDRTSPSVSISASDARSLLDPRLIFRPRYRRCRTRLAREGFLDCPHCHQDRREMVGLWMVRDVFFDHLQRLFEGGFLRRASLSGCLQRFRQPFCVAGTKGDILRSAVLAHLGQFPGRIRGHCRRYQRRSDAQRDDRPSHGSVPFRSIPRSRGTSKHSPALVDWLRVTEISPPPLRRLLDRKFWASPNFSRTSMPPGFPDALRQCPVGEPSIPAPYAHAPRGFPALCRRPWAIRAGNKDDHSMRRTRCSRDLLRADATSLSRQT